MRRGQDNWGIIARYGQRPRRLLKSVPVSRRRLLALLTLVVCGVLAVAVPVWADNKGDKNSCLDRDFVVVIKPDEDATYKNTVDILDEMTINNVKRYAMVDITPQELEVVRATEKNSGK